MQNTKNDKIVSLSFAQQKNIKKYQLLMLFFYILSIIFSIKINFCLDGADSLHVTDSSTILNSKF